MLSYRTGGGVIKCSNEWFIYNGASEALAGLAFVLMFLLDGKLCGASFTQTFPELFHLNDRALPKTMQALNSKP